MSGAERRAVGWLDPARAEALAATIGRDFDPQAALIPFGHLVYF